MNFAVWNETVAAIYAAAAEPFRWPDTMQQIAQGLDARGGLLLYRRDDGRYGTIASPRLAEVNAEYDRCWQHLDVRAQRVLGAIADGHRDVQADHTFFSTEEVAEMPIYQKFLIPHGFGWSMAVSVSPAPDVAVILTLVRAFGKPGFSDAEQEQLLALSRHIERALSLSIRLMDAETQRLGMAEALDQLHCGVFVLDIDQRVLLSNRTAHELLGKGLVVSGGRLTTRHVSTRQALRQRLQSLAFDRTAAAGPCETLIIENGERGLLLQILPLSSSPNLPPLQSASAIVLAVDHGCDRPFDPAIIRDVFRLTLGEARLAALVGGGLAPGEAAAALGIADNTARTVLKRVFEKMGVSRQSELAALMGKLFLGRAPQGGAGASRH